MGLSPELQQRIQNTVRQGERLSRADFERLRQSLRDIDEHLIPSMQMVGPERTDAILRIGLQQEGARLPVTVGEKVMESRVVFRVPPDYPSEAKTAGIQGPVELGIIIGPDGKVQNVQAVTGPPLLVKAAMDAVAQWVYQPYFLNGQPVTLQTTTTINFVLAGAAIGGLSGR